MGIFGTQTCAVCGTSVRPPHPRYRIANQAIICKNCYQKAQIQANQMKMGRIILSADQIKKQIRDIEKFKKMADRKSNSIRNELAKQQITESILDQFSEEQFANVSLLFKKHETILAAVPAQDQDRDVVIILTYAKLIEIRPENILSFPLAAIDDFNFATTQLTFTFNQDRVTWRVTESEQVNNFVDQVHGRLTK